MKIRFLRIAIILVTFFSLFMQKAQASEITETKEYFENGKNYIVETYLLQDNENIEDFVKSEFEKDGMRYKKLDVKADIVITALTKDIEEKAETTSKSNNKTQLLKSFESTKEYVDEDGYKGILTLNESSLNVVVSGNTTKTATKSTSKYYYNLSSNDMSNVPKTTSVDGVSVSLTNVDWINSTNDNAGNTAVGSNYTAKAYYSGTYSYKVPNGYKATVLYKGTPELVNNEGTEYKITYVGEPIPILLADVANDCEIENNLPIKTNLTFEPLVFLFAILGLIIILVLLYILFMPNVTIYCPSDSKFIKIGTQHITKKTPVISFEKILQKHISQQFRIIIKKGMAKKLLNKDVIIKTKDHQVNHNVISNASDYVIDIKL